MHSRLCLWAPGAAVLITHQDHTGAKEELGFYLTTLLVNQNTTKSQNVNVCSPPRFVVRVFLNPYRHRSPPAVRKTRKNQQGAMKRGQR